MPNYHELEKRVTALEQTHGSVVYLVELLESVQGALKIFIVIGNSLKWLVTVIGAIAGAYYAVKHWMVP